MRPWKEPRKNCIRCKTVFPESWPRRDKEFCSNKCRQAAFRERKWKAAEEAKHPKPVPRATRNKPKPKKRRSRLTAKK